MTKPIGFTLAHYHSAEELTPTLTSHHSVNLCVVFEITAPKEFAPHPSAAQLSEQQLITANPDHLADFA